MSSAEPVEYAATVAREGGWGAPWRVEAKRWAKGEGGWGCDEVERDFIFRWSALRFANSERRILRAFRKFDRRREKFETGFTRAAASGGGGHDA